ncbi:carbohydrate-binding module 1 protein [Gryganskiella cystojenkinii]|nr:carbohydrate-binding module 1 protein [Gryganskiella cystojenkinii]
MPEATSPTIATNTLTVTNLEADHFEKETMLKLKAKAESFGDVYYFAPIKSFYRVFVVYRSTFDAQRAKATLHNTEFEGTTLRVYFGQHTEINIDPSRHYLHPPELEKNWLISPPGSPPVGWSQVREDPPNAFHLADDLVKALLEMGQPVYQLPQPDGSFADRSHLFESDVEDFSLDEPTTDQEQGQVKDDQSIKDSQDPQNQEKFSQRLQALKIDTQSSTPTSRTASPGSPSSSLFPPSTPTVLAFQPSKEAEKKQPLITVQDWGVEGENSVSSKLKRRGSIPKTALPTFRPSSH